MNVLNVVRFKLRVGMEIKISPIKSCPRCQTDSLQTDINPVRKLKKGSFKHENGDKREHKCSFCNWWSKAVYSSGKWQWKVADKITADQRIKLEDRKNKLLYKDKFKGKPNKKR